MNCDKNICFSILTFFKAINNLNIPVCKFDVPNAVIIIYILFLVPLSMFSFTKPAISSDAYYTFIVCKIPRIKSIVPKVSNAFFLVNICILLYINIFIYNMNNEKIYIFNYNWFLVINFLNYFQIVHYFLQMNCGNY